MKKINYYVIGGQHRFFCYGGTETLLGAKRLAGKHDEYWDNWQGWHRPKIYRAEDCIETEDGDIVPDRFNKQVWPVSVCNIDTGRWQDCENE